jgi:hypothetical protein
MAGQILDSLRSEDRIEDIMPYITEVAKAGMSVIFLIRYPVTPWVWLQDHWVTTESSRIAMWAGREIIERYSLERQRRLAEETVAPWRNVLRQMGVAATVDVYTGSLGSTVKTYSRRGDISLIMRAHSLPLTSFFGRAMTFSGLFKRVSSPPVLLLRPGQ